MDRGKMLKFNLWKRCGRCWIEEQIGYYEQGLESRGIGGMDRAVEAVLQAKDLIGKS